MSEITTKSELAALAEKCRQQSKEQGAFSADDLNNAVVIFFYVSSSLAYDFHNRNDTPFDVMCDANELFGAMCREMLLKHTGVDIAEVMNGTPLDAEVIE